MSKSAKNLMVSLCGLFLLATPAIAQAVDQQSVATADPAPLTAPPTESTPVTEGDNARAGEQAVETPNLGQGTKAQAEHSAEATAHKSLHDPNNQLGTSLQGRTRPIVEANGSNPAPAVTPPETGAQ